MTRKRTIINRMLMTSPWLTLVLLLGMSKWLPNRAEFSPNSEVRKAQVAQAMNSVPLFIGRWVGQNWDVPPEAQKLLRPNAILGRKYSSPGGPAVNVLIVHCGDARDMIGHYPPVCYPSSGWVQMDSEPEVDSELEITGRVLPVREYLFRRMRDRGQEDVIRIFNAFVLPDGRVTRRIDDINQQSERLAVSVQGVAQVQVITSATIPAEEARHAASELLSGMGVMLDALQVKREGVVHDSGTHNSRGPKPVEQGASQ
jgi:hypothetical protein